jgi:dTDP-4-dehydrorhamnose 3,5-epimerase
MQVTTLALPEITLLRPARHADARGFLSELWNRATLAAHGIVIDFVQDNLVLSAAAGTVRGLHLQRAPHGQTKLVAVLAGAVFDVAVDLRRDSPTFGRHVTQQLSAETGEQLLVPAGFAHGYCTLEPNTLVLYKVDRPYQPGAELALRWSDPALGIAWPVAADAAILNERDRTAPMLAALAV